MLADVGRKIWPIGLLTCVLALGCVNPTQAFAASHFGFENVVAQAQKLAHQSYEPPQAVPEFLTALNQEQWQKIQFKSEKAVWRGKKLPFEVQFFHPGYNYQYPVTVRIVNKYGVGRLQFSRDDFDYPSAKFRDQVPEHLGYAGLRIHYAINRADYKDEVAVFLGASYFRGVGKEQQFGLSARGLAINTGANSGEEFPRFKAYWLCQPAPGAKKLVVYALLDSPSITGAYRFEITPGKATTMDVDAHLFPRTKIAKLGIAPLSSMFMFGENSEHRFRDYRPEVHDSDGLLVHAASAEWLWRPLRNPSRLAINSFDADDAQGFGLLQRDRNFDHYQDLDLHFQSRPSAWVEPQDKWGKGRVELVQIPSDSQMNDNVVAYWVPETPATPGHPLRYKYRLSWQESSPEPADIGRVVATRFGQAVKQEGEPDAAQQVVVDFAGGVLEKLPRKALVNARVNLQGSGALRDIRVQKNYITGGWRLRFAVVAPNATKSVELRAYLVDSKGNPLSQTWSYALSP